MIPNHETQTRFAESNSPPRREKLGYRWNEKFSIKPHGYVFKKLLRLKTFCQRFVNEPETGLRFDSKNEKKETRRQTRFAFNERKRTLWETEDLSLSHRVGSGSRDQPNRFIFPREADLSRGLVRTTEYGEPEKRRRRKREGKNKRVATVSPPLQVRLFAFKLAFVARRSNFMVGDFMRSRRRRRWKYRCPRQLLSIGK